MKLLKPKRPLINPSTLIKSLWRFTLIATVSLSLATLKNWGNYHNYSAKEQIHYWQNIMYGDNSLIPDTQNVIMDGSSSAGARARLGGVSGREAKRALKRLGFTEDRQSGTSHVILKKIIKRTISVSVPQHQGKLLKPGTLRAIIRQAEITIEDFLENL
jgi:predicted RNA binding protein YcfA (HicA-like mRNA interferase family)